MKRTIALSVLVLWTASVWADEVAVEKMPTFSGVRGHGGKDGQLLYRTVAGATVTKPLAEVVSIQIQGQDKLNEAENLLKKGQFAEAVAAYDAIVTGSDAMLKSVIPYRRLRALNQAGLIDRAVMDWLQLTDDSGGTSEICSLMRLPPSRARCSDEWRSARIAPHGLSRRREVRRGRRAERQGWATRRPAVRGPRRSRTPTSPGS